MWSLAWISLLILLFITRKRIYHWMKKEYRAYQMRKKKREVNDRRRRNEGIPRVSKWIHDFVSASDNLDRLVQRHIYLIDETDYLLKQEAQLVSPDEVTICSVDIDHDDEKLKSLQQDLEGTIQEIWLQKQDVGRLVERLDDIPEAWDYFEYFCDEPEDRIWPLICNMRGGCCERQCGCCDKPRRTAAGEAFPYWTLRGKSSDFYSHCTEECGCCRRYWGFRRVLRDEDGSLTCVK